MSQDQLEAGALDLPRRSPEERAYYLSDQLVRVRAECDALRTQLHEARRRMEGACQSIVALSEGSEGFCWCCGCTLSDRTDTCRAFAEVVKGLQESPAPAKEDNQ